MIEFSPAEQALIKRLAAEIGVDVPKFDSVWADDAVLSISDAARDFEVLHGLDPDGSPTPEGLLAPP